MRGPIRALAFVCLVGFCGCANFKQSMEDSVRASSALKSELGLDARVSFKTHNGHTSVVVQLGTPPSGDANEAKKKISDVVNRSFHAKIERIDVLF